MNIVLLGGTFDPIHNGHMAIAEEASNFLSSDVVFLPSGQPWQKSGCVYASVESRLEMVRKAIANKSRFSLSTIETERVEPSYTIDTLRRLSQSIQQQDELFFIMGCDSLLSFASWRQPSEIIRICRLIVVPRFGFEVPDKDAMERIVSGLSRRTIVLDKPIVDVSSTMIRERIRNGLPWEHALPKAVAEYIRQHGLYSRCQDS